MCKVCKAVKGNKALLNEIYNTAFYMGKGESLQKLHSRYSDLFAYNALRTHVQKHQFIDGEDFTNRQLNSIAKKAESQMIKKAIASKEVWDEVINQGMTKLESGEMDINANQMLLAARDKSNFELKQKDQEITMMEMVYHFASGENNREHTRAYDSRRIVEAETVSDNHTTEKSTGNSEAREGRSSSVHYPPAWDAPA